MNHLGLTLCLVFTFATNLWAFPLTPNTKITTGSLCSRSDADYGTNRYAERIAYCNRNVDTQTKAQIYRKYNIPRNCWNRYTIDHFYPLSMGGSNHTDNLWPEHKLVKKTRTNLELETFQQLQAGQITQKEALSIIKESKLHPPMPDSHSGSECDELDN